MLGVRDTYTHSGGSTSTEDTRLDWGASGALLSSGALSITHDAAGQIQQMHSSQGSSTDSLYGDEAIMPGLGSQPLGQYERTASGQVSASEYIYLPTAWGPMPVAAEINGQLYAIHTDQLNTPRRLSDTRGQAILAMGRLCLWRAGADHGGYGVDTPAHRRCGAALQPSSLLRSVPDGRLYAG